LLKIADILQRFVLLVTHASGSYSQPRLLPLPSDLRPISLAMSRDNAYVAVGYGSSIQLYQYHGSTMVWGTSIQVAEFRTPQQVKQQILNFSPDNRYLIIATQKYDKFRGRDDDNVWVRVWRCEQNAGKGTPMGDCQMPTVYHSSKAMILLYRGHRLWIYLVLTLQQGSPRSYICLLRSYDQQSVPRWIYRYTISLISYRFQ